jgi:YD repeat-containing protein
MRNFIFVIAFLISNQIFAQKPKNQGENLKSEIGKTDSTEQEQTDLVLNSNSFQEPFSAVEPFRKMSVPPSPQMASLGVFGETPVNYSTGIASIGIPIHTVSVNGYTHEIALNYHGGGIKVNQVASNIGLGWSLSSSGVLAKNSNKIGGDYVQLPTNYSSFDPSIITNSFSDSRNDQDYMWAHDGLNNCIDTEPDVVSYNFGNNSGIMVPIPGGTYREVPYIGLIVQPGSNDFVIYDKNGTKFTFAVKETTYLPPGCPGSLYYGSGGCINAGIYNDSYYLSQIESKEGGIISFIYEDENYTYAINRLEQRYSWVFGSGCTADDNLIDNNCIQESTVTGKRLVRIETSENEKIEFVYKANVTREDLPGSKILQDIKVYNNGDSNPVKTILFGTSYFSSSGSTGPNHQAAWDKRLKLDQLTINSDQVYLFSYNGNLSPRLSYDQDYYGYHIFSGASTATPYDTTHNVNGANREPQSSRVTAGLLNRITYPTKGYSTFEYEQNGVYFGNQNSVGPGVRIKRINAFSGNDILSRYTDYKYTLNESVNSSGLIDNLQGKVNFIDQQSQWQHDPDTGPYKLECNFYVVSSDDQLSSYFGRTYNVTYSRVEEVVNDGSQGKTVYHFSKIGDLIPNPSVNIADMNYDWTYGIPTKVETFKSTSVGLVKVEEKLFLYKTFITNNTIYQADAGPSSYYSFGMKLSRERAEVEPGQFWQFKPAVYNMFKFGYVSAFFAKYKEVTKSFTPEGIFEREKDYSIDSLNSRIIKEVFRSSNSPSDSDSRFFYYTNQIGSQGFFQLYRNPVLFIDQKTIGATQYTIGGKFFPLTLSSGKWLNLTAYDLGVESQSTEFSLNLSNPTSDPLFRKVSEVLAINPQSYPTLIDEVGKKTKIFYDFSESKPVAIIENFENSGDAFAYSSFETSNKGGWTYSGTPTTTFKTGKKGYNLRSGSITKTGITASSSNPYKVGFWARKTSGQGSVNISGQTESLTTAWKWVEKTITASSLTISGKNIIVDELRLHPSYSMMTSYTYEPLVGITSKTDSRGYSVTYEYDTSGRLKSIKNEDGHILEQYEYNYASGN